MLKNLVNFFFDAMLSFFDGEEYNDYNPLFKWMRLTELTYPTKSVALKRLQIILLPIVGPVKFIAGLVFFVVTLPLLMCLTLALRMCDKIKQEW